MKNVQRRCKKHHKNVVSLVGTGGLAYNSHLAVAQFGRRPPLAVLPAGKTSLRASRPHATEAVLSLLSTKKHRLCGVPWWAREDSNLRPLHYQCNALTT